MELSANPAVGNEDHAGDPSHGLPLPTLIRCSVLGRPSQCLHQLVDMDAESGHGGSCGLGIAAFTRPREHPAAGVLMTEKHFAGTTCEGL